MSYQQLLSGFGDITLLRESLGLLEWDASVMMPEDAAERRGQQMACIDGLAYERLEQMAAILDKGQLDDCPKDAWNQANLTEMRRQVAQTLLVPKDLQKRIMQGQSRCEMAWRSARAESDFSLVQDALTDLLSMTKDALAAQAEGLNISIMDAAVGSYEPELTAKQAGQLLEEHAVFVQDFLPVAQEKSAKRLRDHPKGLQLSIADQDRVCRAICARMGLDKGSSRIDVSLHPFSSGNGVDSRITVRFNADDALSSISAAIHETGHAMYERQLPQEWNMQPVGQSRGMLLHESQSLTMEMQACRSPEFLGWLVRYLQKELSIDVTVDALLAQSLVVKPSPIRVEADEVTYPLHVLLRFRLEQQLVSGNLSVAELPEAFRAGQKSLLGLDITDDAEGCLQDIHWHIGAFGYFPSYALGAMAAAQLFASAKAADAELMPSLAEGKFDRLLSWMGQNVHHKASSMNSNAILREATDAELSSLALQQHIHHRYG